MNYPWKPRHVLATASLMLLAPVLSAQQTNASDALDSDDSDVIELSPFTVDTTQDKGYRATNSVTGSRLNTLIKDIPMPIEVITEQFVKDTGSTDLRESLRYSAGIVLESQNDAGQGNTFVNEGGVHSNEGATAAKTQTTVKMRGFITDSVLRDGFRRQHATDSANIGRIEVVRGPAALLYGIGNFGGIVNYMPKRPLDEDRHEVSVATGTHGYRRAAFDTNYSFNGSDKLGFRMTGAVQTGGDHTDLKNSDKFFIAPVVVYKPWENTTLTFDVEYGEEEITGTGFQSVRARADVPADQQDRLERAGFLDFTGEDRRTFRWSGPDTYVDAKASNILFKVDQKLAENLYLVAGYNKSFSRFSGLDVGGALQVGVGPESQRGTVNVLALSPDDLAFQGGSLSNVTFQYQWSNYRETTDREQLRAELTYNFDTFEDSKWLSMNHNLLAGYSDEYSDKKRRFRQTLPGLNNYRNPANSDYIRYGTQGDGSVDAEMGLINNTRNEAWNEGLYAVYQGTWLDDRLTIVGGIRRDSNDNSVGTIDALNAANSSQIDRDEQSKNTSQIGVSLKLNRNISIFALEAEGLVPNFDGLQDGNGRPIDATIAKSEEYGVKLDLFNGKLSGTISAFNIERTGTPYFYWWSPAPSKGQFDASKPITYLVQGANPEPGNADWSVAQQNAVTEWNAAKAAGAAYQQDGKWYLNASTSAGAAYMDKVYANVAAGQGWPGWYFDIDDPNVNIATMDRAAPDRGTYQAYSSGDDESKGYDFQLLWAPTEQFQMLLTYSHLERRTLNVGKFPFHPAVEDRWANWYFPDGSWGLSGYPLNEAYSDPYDSSSWTGAGYLGIGSDDDTPEDAAAFWATYKFAEDGVWAGLTFGIGGQYESEREFVSARTDGSGQLQVDANGNPIALYTDPRINIDAMISYNFDFMERESRIQLNVNNLMDDRDQYGLGFAGGISARVEFGMVF
ncbi:TonB-dependent receptor plug domain-containing protein [Opitutaceae bacterium]|nr:TonB-dependent receptor plug domain-containing protein [Opitutaceae bacterium]